jgi:hypothetical protein
MPRSPATPDGDARMLVFVTRPFRSSDVAFGVGCLVSAFCDATADGVRRCLVRYEADRGRAGRVAEAWWREGLRLLPGEAGADDAGDRWEGGVYGIPMAGCADSYLRASLGEGIDQQKSREGV